MYSTVRWWATRVNYSGKRYFETSGRQETNKNHMHASELRKQLQKLANPEMARHSRRFFKTAPGEYGEGDEFLGIRVPDQRRIAKQFKSLPLPEVQKLLQSHYHEERLTALFILELQFAKSDDSGQKTICDFYLKNIRYVNNWDLVDSSAYKIMGVYLFDKPRDILFELAASDDLWERRIAIISTFHFIRQGDLDDTFRIAEMFLRDGHDLMHKATGWMLREAGKRNPSRLKDFLRSHSGGMPRTMLRYTIEKLPENQRKAWLSGING